MCSFIDIDSLSISFSVTLVSWRWYHCEVATRPKKVACASVVLDRLDHLTKRCSDIESKSYSSSATLLIL